MRYSRIGASSRVARAAGGAALGALLVVGAARAAEDASRPSINPMRSLDKTSFKGFVDEPLFDPMRRLPPPPPPPVVMAPPPPPVVPPEPPPGLRLLGLVQGDMHLAIVRRDGQQKSEILATGDRLGAWEVNVLPSGNLELRNGARTADYPLFKPLPGSPGPSTAMEEAAPHLMNRRQARVQDYRFAH